MLVFSSIGAAVVIQVQLFLQYDKMSLTVSSCFYIKSIKHHSSHHLVLNDKSTIQGAMRSLKDLRAQSTPSSLSFVQNLQKPANIHKACNI